MAGPSAGASSPTPTPGAGDQTSKSAVAVKGQRVRARLEDAARRAVVSGVSDGSKVPVVFDDDGSEAEVTLADLSPLKDFESKEALDGIVGMLSVEEASQLRRQANELFAAMDAQAAAERCSAVIQRLSFQEQALEQPVLVLRGREIWEGCATQAAEAGTSRVRFVRVLEGPDYRASKKDERQARLKVELPKDEQLPNERVFAAQHGKLGREQLEFHLSRARCWMALGQAQRAVLDCNLAAALCRFLAPAAPKRAPGFQFTVPLLVLAVAMAFAKQVVAGIVLAIAAFVVDHVANRQAKRAALDPHLSAVMALRGRAKLLQGLSGFANSEHRAATEELGSHKEGPDLVKLRRELRAFRNENKHKRMPMTLQAERSWRTAAVEKIAPGAFLLSQEKESRPKQVTFGDMKAKFESGEYKENEKFGLGYLDYVGDGFEAM